MMKTVVKKIFRETDSFAGKEITLSGWVRNIRISKNFGFIELNDGTFFKNIQIVLEALGGGGHMNIAGAKVSNITMEEAVQRLKESMKKNLRIGE